MARWRRIGGSRRDLRGGTDRRSNTVVGFIGPEYLYDGKQIIRGGLEDHFCGKLLGLPMGVDVCYTNHAEADPDDMDTLLTLLGVAGCNYNNRVTKTSGYPRKPDRGWIS